MNILKRKKLIAFIITAIVLLLFGTIYFVVHNYTNEKEEIITGEKLEEEIIENVETGENELEIPEEIIIAEDVKPEEIITEQKTEIKQNTQNNNSQKTDAKVNNTPTNVNTNTNNNQNSNNNVPKTQDPPPPVPTSPPVEETKPKEPVETWKYNSTMAQQLKNDIENNPSELMKQYGYSVVIDESIVSTTSQFTYTKSRVLDKIKNKFGTVKVYARDYYVDGQLRWTECFVI